MHQTFKRWRLSQQCSLTELVHKETSTEKLWSKVNESAKHIGLKLCSKKRTRATVSALKIVSDNKMLWTKLFGNVEHYKYKVKWAQR